MCLNPSPSFPSCRFFSSGDFGPGRHPLPRPSPFFPTPRRSLSSSYTSPDPDCPSVRTKSSRSSPTCFSKGHEDLSWGPRQTTLWSRAPYTSRTAGTQKDPSWKLKGLSSTTLGCRLLVGTGCEESSTLTLTSESPSVSVNTRVRVSHLHYHPFSHLFRSDFVSHSTTLPSRSYTLIYKSVRPTDNPSCTRGPGFVPSPDFMPVGTSIVPTTLDVPISW